MLHVSRKLTFILALCLSFLFSLNTFATKIGYSGRLVQTDGTPITGTADLQFDLYYSNDLTISLATNTVNTVPLSNGIYTVELDFPTIGDLIKNTPVGESLVIQVKDIFNGLTFDTQAILATPVASYAVTAESIADAAVTPLSLDFVGACADNQVIIKSGSQFDCVDQTAGIVVDSTLVNNAGVIGQATVGTAGTYTSVTVDAYGRITAGSNPATTVGSTEITDGSIVNADINAAAAISWSKIDKTGASSSDVGLGNVLNVAQIPASDLDNSGTLDSATQVPSELAVKGYVDTTAQTIADAKVIDDMTGMQTTVAPSVNSVKNYVTSQVGAINSSQWTTTGSDIYYNTGNVGIGTTLPTHPLNVEANNTAAITSADESLIKVRNTVFDDNTTGSAYFGHNSAGKTVIANTRTTIPGGIAFYTGQDTTEKMFLDRLGNLGIGTSSPTQKLTVDGNINVTTTNDICIDGGNCLSTVGSGDGTVTSVATGTGLTGGPITTTGTISVDVGITNGKIPQVGVGDKLADSIINYNPALDVALTGFANGAASSVVATDTILQAFGKVQAQLDAHATSIAGNTINNSDDVAEGTTNLYFTDIRAQTAAVVDSTAGVETTQAPSVSAMKNYVDARATQWTTTGSDIYYNTGYVGIGTITPSAALEVFGDIALSTGADRRIFQNSAEIKFIDRTTQSGSILIQNDTLGVDIAGGDIIIQNRGGGRNGTVGKVGIYGTDSGNQAGGIVELRAGNASAAGDGGDVKISGGSSNSDTNINLPQRGGNVTLTGGTNDELQSGTGTRYAGSVVLQAGQNTAGVAENGFVDMQYHDGTSYQTGFRFQGSDGNVGIGTTSPTQKLTVAGGMNVTTGNDICIDGSGCLSTVISANGEPNTASSAGGASLVLAKSGTDLPFKGLTSTSGITLTSNAADIAIGLNSAVVSSTALATPLTGYTVGTNAVLAPTDTILSAYGKLQAQINANYTAITGLSTTDDLAEGATNLYFTPVRAQTAAVVNSTAGSETTQAASVSAMKSYVTTEVGAVNQSQWTTSGSNIYYNTGNVGIGTTSPSTALTVSGDSTVWGKHEVDYTGVNDALHVHQEGTGNLLSLSTGAGWDQKFIVDNLGYVGIGTTSPTEMLHVSGNVLAAAYLYTSDERFKENVETIVDPLYKVNSLRGVTFDWKTEEFPERNFPQEKTVGFIAQEVEKVQPELVKTGKDGYKSVQYGNITALLVEAVKSISKSIDKLFSNDKDINREIASLKEENEQLKAEMQEMRDAIKKLQEVQKANKK